MPRPTCSAHGFPSLTSWNRELYSLLSTAGVSQNRLLGPNGQFESGRNLSGMVKKMGSLGERERGNEALKPMTWVFEIL